jgi:hypothetical protein
MCGSSKAEPDGLAVIRQDDLSWHQIDDVGPPTRTLSIHPRRQCLVADLSRRAIDTNNLRPLDSLLIATDGNDLLHQRSLRVL